MWKQIQSTENQPKYQTLCYYIINADLNDCRFISLQHVEDWKKTFKPLHTHNKMEGMHGIQNDHTVFLSDLDIHSGLGHSET